MAPLQVFFCALGGLVQLISYGEDRETLKNSSRFPAVAASSKSSDMHSMWDPL